MLFSFLPVLSVWLVGTLTYFFHHPLASGAGILLQLTILVVGLFHPSWRFFSAIGLALVLMFNAGFWMQSHHDSLFCHQLDEHAIARLEKRIQKESGWKLQLSHIEARCDGELIQVPFGELNIRHEKLKQRLEYLPIGAQLKLMNVNLQHHSRFYLSLTTRSKSKIYNETQWQKKLNVDPGWVKMQAKIDYYLDQPLSGILKALLLADRKGLDTQWKTLIVDQGIFHLFAISGLHVGLLYFWIRFLFRGVFLVSAFKVHQGRGWIVLDFLSLILIYMFLDWIGLPLTALRAWLMLAAWIFCQHFLRFLPTWKILLMVGAWMLLADSSMIGQVSFQLSFLSVGAILVLYPLLPKTSLKQSILKRYSLILFNLFCISLWIQLITLPVLWIYFKQFTWLSFLVNPIHILYVGFVFMPSALFLLLIQFTTAFNGVMWWPPEVYIYSWMQFTGTVWTKLIQAGAWITRDSVIQFQDELGWSLAVVYWLVLGVFLRLVYPRLRT